MDDSEWIVLLVLVLVGVLDLLSAVLDSELLDDLASRHLALNPNAVNKALVIFFDAVSANRNSAEIQKRTLPLIAEDAASSERVALKMSLVDLGVEVGAGHLAHNSVRGLGVPANSVRSTSIPRLHDIRNLVTHPPISDRG